MDDLGWTTVKDGDYVPFDIFDCAFNSSLMTCRLFYGDYINSRPARIICGNLLVVINVGQRLNMAFAMTNPQPLSTTSQQQLAIPIFIYSYDPYFFLKINYNTINVAFSMNNANQTAIRNAYFYTTNNQLELAGESLYLARYHIKSIVTGDSYVLKFNFPIRVNGKFTSGCKTSGGITIGDLYYH